ncbi:hypothetical protein B5F25_20180 [Bacteroides sp. An19]|nr:hypothetical protein B5F25_20180 [Bacteroides sp. An19]
MRKIAGYLTKNRSEKDQKIAQSTHEKGYIKPRKTFWRNSKQLLSLFVKEYERTGKTTQPKHNYFSSERIFLQICWLNARNPYLCPQKNKPT